MARLSTETARRRRECLPTPGRWKAQARITSTSAQHGVRGPRNSGRLTTARRGPLARQGPDARPALASRRRYDPGGDHVGVGDPNERAVGTLDVEFVVAPGAQVADRVAVARLARGGRHACAHGHPLTDVGGRDTDNEAGMHGDHCRLRARLVRT